MTHWSEPKVVIPKYDIPPGVRMSIQTVDGTLTLEKQSDGGWEAVGFDGKNGTKVPKSLDKRRQER